MRILIPALLGLVLLSGCTALMLGGTSSTDYPASRGAGGPSAQDSGTSADVRRELIASRQLDASGIVVNTSGGRVTLQGTVGSHAERAHAAAVAGSVANVIAVDNRIRVVQSR